MFNLVKNTLRGIKKRLFQYFGIVVLLVIAVATMTGLYSNSERVSSSFYTVAKSSGTYDYRIKVERLSDYKDIDTALIRVKDILKNQFPEDLPNHGTILSQIDSIKNNDIQNNLLPTITSGSLDENLKLLLLNWGISYKAILANDLLNHEVAQDSTTSYYQIKKSFLKSFDTNQTKRLFFSFEDAFYVQKMPPWLNNNEDLRFNFSPFRDGFNEVYITEGKEPKAKNEVIINPTFAKKNNISLNDQFEFITDQILKVVGFGYAYWGIISEPSPDNIAPLPDNTTQVFTTREWSNEYVGSGNGSTKLATPFFLKVKNKDSFFETKIESIFSQFFNFNYGNLITVDTNDYRSGFLKQSFDMATIIYSSISFFVLLAAMFIVLSYVRKEIDIQKKQIGLIKALGYNNNEVSFGFTCLIFLLSIFSTAIGFALGLPLQMYFNNLNNFGYFLPLPTVHFSLLALLLGVVVSTCIFTLASYLQSYSTLTKNPLALIHERTSSTGTKWLAFFKKPFNYWSFKPRLAISFALKSVGKLTLIFFTFVFVSFLLLFQTIVSDIFDSKIDNLQNYVNSEVYLSSTAFNMYKFDNQGKITSQVYDWVLEKNLDPEKALKSEDFHIDSQAKYDKLKRIINSNDFRNYYMKSPEMSLLYQNINEDGVDYIRPPGTDFISLVEALAALGVLNQFFEILINYSSMDPTSEALPGVSLGQMIINNNYYPNLEFSLNTPAQWIDHNQGPLVSKWNQVITLYNNSDEDNPLAWKSWFNLKEERSLDIDPVFNSPHNLTQETVTYVDSFGQERTQSAYIVPSVISKSLAVLNKYKVGDKVLMILNTSNTFVPIIFEIKGIAVTNLDMSHFYTQIDDLRRIIGYTSTGDFNGQPIVNSFNNYYSKDKTVLPLNSINILQSNGDYTMAGLQNSWSLINADPLVFPLIKGRLVELFQSVQDIVAITKWLTIAALAFVLVIIINMILDNNILIIAMMKAMGYRINEINGLIIGSYIFALILAFIIGTVLGYVTWWLILLLVAKLSSTIFLLPISAVTILVSFALVFLVIIIGYAIGLYFIKFKPVTSLLQSG